jgi:hypothetical protein
VLAGESRHVVHGLGHGVRRREEGQRRGVGHEPAIPDRGRGRERGKRQGVLKLPRALEPVDPDVAGSKKALASTGSSTKFG